MKKTRIVLVGALVLALAFVMGCKQNEDLSVEEHRQDGRAQHIWEAEYTGNKYIRSALHFSEDTAIDEKAKVTVEMAYPGNGKAGILFGLKERTASGEKKYDFYSFAFGWNGNKDNPKLEAYIDYYQGLTSFKDESTNSEKFGTGANISIVPNTELTGASWNGSELFDADMYVTYDAENDNYDVKITKKGDVNTVYFEESDITAKGKTGTGFSSDLVENKGGKLYSYGMLSGQRDPKKVKTIWKFDTTYSKSAE